MIPNTRAHDHNHQSLPPVALFASKHDGVRAPSAARDNVRPDISRVGGYSPPRRHLDIDILAFPWTRIDRRVRMAFVHGGVTVPPVPHVDRVALAAVTLDPDIAAMTTVTAAELPQTVS